LTDNTPTGPAPKRTPSTRAASAAKTPAAKSPAAKAPVAKAPAAKAPVAKAPAAKTPAAKPVAKSPAVEPTAATTTTSTAVAPAGWYPVAAGSAQQRLWDGTRWTEHTYDPPAAAQPAAATHPGTPREPSLRAPAGTKPNTIWFWLLVVGAPVLTILDLIPTSIYLSQVISGDTTDPTAMAANTFNGAYLLVLLSGWFIYAACIVFGLLDWRELRAHGVPKPFHWAWSFFVIAVGWPAVYVIGRTVVVKRRTGIGMAPLWVFIGLEVVAFIVTAVVVITAIVQLISVFSDGLAAAGNVL
jgi:hypothetical protein